MATAFMSTVSKSSILTALLLPLIALLTFTRCSDSPSGVAFRTVPDTGAVCYLGIEDDAAGMNWVLTPDRQQYDWVTDNYGWGLGYLTINGEPSAWHTPAKVSSDGATLSYQAGGISIEVSRRLKKGELLETYTFRNTGTEAADITDCGIYTPWNDNYPDAETCIKSRCNAHIWAGDNAAYVFALRMGDDGSGAARGGGNLGLIVTEGAVADYEVWERGRQKAYSNFRGVISLMIPDQTLAPGGSYTVGWTILEHSGRDDFRRKLLNHGSAIVESDKFVFQQGEEAKVYFRSKSRLSSAAVGGEAVQTASDETGTYATFEASTLGEQDVVFSYGKGRTTHATILTVSGYDNLLSARADFILSRQQMNLRTDPRNGAYMVYDNELQQIYTNDGKRASSDTDEGRERVGMGLFLATWYRQHPSAELLHSLERYAAFIRNQLQTSDYTTRSQVGCKGVHRGYNYPWVASFYFAMYEITGKKQYASYGYHTLRALFRNFGYGFYCINMPVLSSLDALQDAALTAERDTLLSDYARTAGIFMDNGLNFPKFEVNYEQSIVAPAVEFLLEYYLATGDERYLSAAREMLPVAENFCGFQPHYRMHEIAIRHWDGYWFGKRQFFGDVFPHYWSCINAMAYHCYALATGDDSYQRRAEEIVRNNLSNVSEDGSGSCAFVFPRRVNGLPAHFADPYANDQDWALYYYLQVNNN